MTLESGDGESFRGKRMATITEVLRRPTSYTGLWSWVTTVDHKRIGILYGATALIFLLMGGVQALLIRAQLAVPDATVVSSDTYSQLFTMHGTTMVFLVIMPLGASFFNYMIPLQIGARDVAFPRLNAFSYWMFLFGGVLLSSSFLFGEAPDSGWFMYANITERAVGQRTEFWVLGLQLLGISSLAAAFNFAVTIINMRAPGMSLMRMPVFTWMSLVVMILLILAFPIITVGVTQLMLDRIFGATFFVASKGGDPLLWQHIFWLFGHPEVYILILPAMGVVSEVLPTFARKPLFGYSVVVYSGIVIGFMSFGVWSHHMFTVGLGPTANSAFSIATMLIAVPTGVKIFNWIGTLWGGSIDFKTPLLFSLGFISMFIIGGLSGVMHASVPSDFQQQDTYFVVAHFHYVLFGGSLFGIFSGIYYWWPKMTGRLLHEGLGKIHFWLIFIGFNVTFFPMHFLGMDGMPRRIFTYSSEMGWDFWNMVSSIGSFIIAFSMLFFILNIFRTMRKGEIANGDPWDARTLEWSMSSPPPIYNFETIPTVTSRDDWWERKQESGAVIAPPRDASGYSEPDDDGHGHGIHMPGLSYYPILASLGLSLAAAGLLIHLAVSGVGLTIAIVGIYGWCFEPASD
jgi:cytochrome c oxidase subunit 1